MILNHSKKEVEKKQVQNLKQSWLINCSFGFGSTNCASESAHIASSSDRDNMNAAMIVTQPIGDYGNFFYEDIFCPAKLPATMTTSAFLNFMDRQWEDVGLNILGIYEDVTSYENKYGKESRKLLDEWKSGSLVIENSEYNDWLIKYLQIADFVKE